MCRCVGRCVDVVFDWPAITVYGQGIRASVLLVTGLALGPGPAWVARRLQLGTGNFHTFGLASFGFPKYGFVLISHGNDLKIFWFDDYELFLAASAILGVAYFEYPSESKHRII